MQGVVTGKRLTSVGLVTTFGADVGDTFLLNLVKILSPLSDKLYVLGPNTILRSSGNIHLYPIGYKLGEGIFAQVMNQVSFQLRMSYRLARLTGKVKLWVFFGGEGLLLPMLMAKLFRGKVALALAGYLEREGEFRKNVLYKPFSLLKRINCRLADGIIIYSQRLIEEWQLSGYRNKVVIAHEHFLDFDKFRPQKRLGERRGLIGYIGRLDPEKGILNLLEAIPMVLERDDNISFLLGGDGLLRSKVEECLSRAKLNDRASFVGYISHDKVPKQLNELKLFVLPSYTEGISNIMLEAMACGTPVLATPVGAIPDVIKDEQTGFIMENNSPECLARNIMRALSHPKLGEIAENGRALVQKEFNFEKTRERFKNALADINSR
jgi:glycosyltransferase involved in cell wall biosynthesis